MRRILIISLASMVGWASPAGAGFFSSTGPVIAIFAGELFLVGVLMVSAVRFPSFKKRSHHPGG